MRWWWQPKPDLHAVLTGPLFGVEEPDPEPEYDGPRNPNDRPDDWPRGGLPPTLPAEYDVSHAFAGMSEEAMGRLVAHRRRVKKMLKDFEPISVFDGLDAAEEMPDDYHGARAARVDYERRVKARKKAAKKREKAQRKAEAAGKML